jgi:O-antigen/teichoic acid export membrane protein
MVESTKHKVVNAIGWSSLASVINYVMLFSRTFILVRFLAPADFGIMALSLLLVTTIKQLSHVGLEQALIQDTTNTAKTMDTIWTVSVVRGFLFFAIIIVMTPYYAAYFSESALIPILTLVSFSAIFNGFRNSYVIASQKALDFDLLFKLNVITAVVEFMTTITLAIIYGDVIALAIGYLTGSVTGCILSFVIFKSRPNFHFSTSEFFKLFHFGKWIFSGGIVIFLILNIDTSVVGKMLGVVLLGYYQVAFRVANFAATDIVLTFSKALYPAYSYVKSDTYMLKKYFLTTIFFISVTVLPLMTLVGLYADSFVALFIGITWEEMVSPLKVLIIFGIVRSFASITGYVFWTLGRPKIQTMISLSQLLLIVLCIFPLISKFSITGAAWGVTLPLMCTSIVSFYFTVKLLRISIHDCLTYFLSPLLALFTLVLAISIIQTFFPNIPSITFFILNSIFLAFIYLGFLYIFDHFGSRKGRNLVTQLFQVIKNK